MPLNLLNALKDLNRLEIPKAKKKKQVTPAEDLAKAVTVSISAETKMLNLNDNLK
tara:strand:+ start:1044 stop:1208 length:165 start_codon:yes stop_codon:yes gene_type:complete